MVLSSAACRSERGWCASPATRLRTGTATEGGKSPSPSTRRSRACPSDADASDRHADVFRFVNHLPPDQRRVIVERFVEQRSIREIAGRLNKTEGAVKQLQFRALQSLRTWMEDANA